MHRDCMDLQPATDVFGLEFAVSQWKRLVNDAEVLFHKLIKNGLCNESRMQVEQWLCIKQEFADGFINNGETAMNIPEKVTRSLERIDEVTEYDEISTEERSSSNESDDVDSHLESDSVLDDDAAACSNSVSVVDNKMQYFEEKLDVFMHRFRVITDNLIDNQLGSKRPIIEDVSGGSLDGIQKGASNFRRKSLIAPEGLELHPNASLCQTNLLPTDFEDDFRNIEKTGANINDDELAINFHNFLYYEKNITEKYKAIALNYEKRLQDLELIKQLAGDSAKKVADMENDLQNSKKRMQKLVRLLKRTEEHKCSLEKTIIEDQKRIYELEEKCKLQFDKPKPVKSILPLYKEEKETFRGGQWHSVDLNNSNNVNKESLRLEIINLRKTREYLLDQRRSLDSKLNKDKVFSNAEERKFLELDEAIEAIDTAIEYKNEIICGHNSFARGDAEREKGEELLMQRLMNLSKQEMRSLLYTYFRKVVDLRESGRKLEQQLADQDHQIETQTWKIRALSNAVQQAHIENERRLVMVHREHDEKLHLMFRHYGEQIGMSANVVGETSTTGGSSLDREMDKVDSLDTQPLLQLPGALPKNQQQSKSITIPQQNLKKLQGSLSTHTTKVTRKKNKLIIQQHKAKH